MVKGKVMAESGMEREWSGVRVCEGGVKCVE
jgi:hypothetical protein